VKRRNVRQYIGSVNTISPLSGRTINLLAQTEFASFKRGIALKHLRVLENKVFWEDRTAYISFKLFCMKVYTEDIKKFKLIIFNLVTTLVHI
jgi:hypothetical protein